MSPDDETAGFSTDDEFVPGIGEFVPGVDEDYSPDDEDPATAGDLRGSAGLRGRRTTARRAARTRNPGR